ncbi:MAG TPA: magnesium transporter [Candidatus Nanoarchaeia archaeon]|nr:magnesium transporter [Candidatus Nanoarchaeia archaeon]
MFHAGSSSFSKSLKETFIAFAFDIGGIAAGFLVAYQLGVFHAAPWALALFPAVLGAKGVIEGMLSGRLSTALHIGTAYPKLSNNTKSFYSLIGASIVLTLVTSVAMSAVAIVFGQEFWGITFADFPSILVVILATMTLGLVLLIVTVKVAFVSFSRGLDPDIMVYPIMSMISSVFITICYVVVLNLFFNLSTAGVGLVVLFSVIDVVLALYIFRRNLHDTEFTKTIQESLAALMIVAVMVNFTGTVLRGIDRYASRSIEFYAIYPALIGIISDVGSVVGSTATTKLALGMLKPKLSSILQHAKNIFSAWIASVVMFVILALLALVIHGTFTPTLFYNHVITLLIANIIAVFLVVILSFAISILTFQKGLDPGNFVIPIETAFAAGITTVALLAALGLMSLGL